MLKKVLKTNMAEKSVGLGIIHQADVRRVIFFFLFYWSLKLSFTMWIIINVTGKGVQCHKLNLKMPGARGERFRRLV